MGFSPETISPETLAEVSDESGKVWTPLFSHDCSFPPEIFRQVMLNLIRNPNLNSNHLFRGDISLDCPFNELPSITNARIAQFSKFELKTVMVRTMIPRNIIVDKPLDQTCLFYHQDKSENEIMSLVVYLPHITTPSESPFYHPAVHGIGFLHSYNSATQQGRVSIHYSFFDSEPRSVKLERTAQHLLAVLYKHGQGLASGYVKRVHHDLILPQAAVQNTYARLKAKYARKLVESWVETTDPAKHVFEDLGIAAFLIELWAEMFPDQDHHPISFVDIGCGNGLLVHILIEEGYQGRGFDARRRKSWSTFSQKTQDNLKEQVLIPSIISTHSCSSKIPDAPSDILDAVQEISLRDVSITESLPGDTVNTGEEVSIQDGRFPKGTFIISNHADELTAWTPILASLSECPFLMIPCCSHALSGARFRAPSPRTSGPPISAYASLVAWVTKLATDCGWEVEKEMLRIPSTRNTALIGRHRSTPYDSINLCDLVSENGDAAGWENNALKLVKGAVRGH